MQPESYVIIKDKDGVEHRVGCEYDALIALEPLENPPYKFQLNNGQILIIDTEQEWHKLAIARRKYRLWEREQQNLKI